MAKNSNFSYHKKNEEVPFDLVLQSDFPVKLTFLKSASGEHIFGQATVWEDELLDPEIIFPTVSPKGLIPSVSSYGFAKDLSGAGLDFFLINDGFTLNRDNPSFADIIAGGSGRLAFIDRFDEWQNTLASDEDGNLFWQNKDTGKKVADATAATVHSTNPLLVWIPDDEGEIVILSGHIFHSFARADKLALNADGFKHSALFFDSTSDSLTLGFCELLEPDSGAFTDVRFKLEIGKENTAALKPATIGQTLSFADIDEDEISSVIIKIGGGFKKGEKLRPWGLNLEDSGEIEGTSITLTNLDKDGSLLLDGQGDKDLYLDIIHHLRLLGEPAESLSPRTLSFKIMTEQSSYNMTEKDLVNAPIGLAANASVEATSDFAPTPEEQEQEEEKIKETEIAAKETEEAEEIPQVPEQEQEQNEQPEESEITPKPLTPEEENDAVIAKVAKFLAEEPLETPKPRHKLFSSSSSPAPAQKATSTTAPTPASESIFTPADDKLPSAFRPTALAASERKTVLITGAAKRIGKDLALNFAHDGWNVIIHCNTSLTEARALAKEIAKCKVRTAILQANLLDPEEVEQIFPQVENVFPKIDCLVNNASIFEPDEFATTTEDSWNRHMMINLRAPFMLSQAFAAQYEKQDKSEPAGNIINIIDAATTRTFTNFFSYRVSKSALLEVTKMSALALAPKVKVNAIAPWQVLPSAHTTAKELEDKIAASPMQERTSLPEIYKAVKLIIDSPSMTGQMLSFDSGMFV